MNGVEILASNEIIISRSFNWSNFWFSLGLIFILAIIVGIGCGCTEHSWEMGVAISVVMFIICSLFVAIPISAATGTSTEYETHYKVTIDDSVSMNEFLDKYEIIDQEGKIYTVKEK